MTSKEHMDEGKEEQTVTRLNEVRLWGKWVKPDID